MKKIILILLAVMMLSSSMSMAYVDKAIEEDRLNIIGVAVKLGLGYWGFTRQTNYGNVTGFIFIMSGTIQLLQIEW